VGGVRGETTWDNIVFETQLQDFEGLVRPEAVTNQDPWFLVSSLLSLGIKYIRLSHSNLILESVYPESEYA
jgi:hypothetical protein